MDGKEIYAINHQQEICKIGVQGSRLVVRRRIHKLSNPEEVVSSHILQLTPWTFAIGSVRKMNGRRDEPCLHLISGDISDQKEEPIIRVFPMPIPEFNKLNEYVTFRSLYVKER